MKITFVATVKNEAHSIANLLTSLKHQTKQPDEIIIIDGGSSDNTLEKINQISRQLSLNLRVLRKKSNRSRGRNLGIGEAIGEGIAISDAGCTLDKNWLKTISKPLIAKKADVVAGFYKMKTDTIFGYCSAPFFGPMSHNINKHTFLPSSRSIAFTKQAWQKVSGYPDHVSSAAEDTIFAQNLFDDPNIKMTTRLRAVVNWTQPQTTKAFFKDIVKHVKGDIEAGYIRHLKKNWLVAIRYAFAFSLITASLISLNPTVISVTVLLTALYLAYPSLKFIKLVKHPMHPFYFAFLQITADLAVISALFTKINNRHAV